MTKPCQPSDTAANGTSAVQAEDLQTPIATIAYPEPTLTPASITTSTIQVPPPPTNSVLSSSFPPPGAPDGGTWGKRKEAAEQTWLVCALLCFAFGPFAAFGLPAFCCPCDEKDAYMVNGKIYNTTGHYVGDASNVEFIAIPRYQQMGRLVGPDLPQAVAPGTVTKSITEMSDGSRQITTTTFNLDGSRTVKTSIEN
mmetsp:Transcript_241/g.301  ORF Transcript_241/g.301 Transcript_241/m.301 type:complete len:197 (+) Transcript_241:76-666(+)|eukprot:CAMPEP_0195270496 /NCGR_PEP_ID=MMETSP0706-20130129/14392_1 /TAXON_ID=33640 /ORGANISM="Asterionellopsis glacialis, Strain CCMP134" /LENGTH=196 /DNA_ID=CAMNT_0040325793 /DNA_START=67 /DNA_END=657 /DNA_ORIENTATION=+